MKEVYLVTPLEFNNVMFRKLGIEVDTPVKSTHIFNGDDWAHTLCNLAKKGMLIVIHTTLWEDLPAHQNREICLKSSVLVSDQPAEEFNKRYNEAHASLVHFVKEHPSSYDVVDYLCNQLIEEEGKVVKGERLLEGKTVYIAAPPGHVNNGVSQNLASQLAKDLGVKVENLADIHGSDIKQRVIDRKLREIENGRGNRNG